MQFALLERACYLNIHFTIMPSIIYFSIFLFKLQPHFFNCLPMIFQPPTAITVCPLYCTLPPSLPGKHKVLISSKLTSEATVTSETIVRKIQSICTNTPRVYLLTSNYNVNKNSRKQKR